MDEITRRTARRFAKAVDALERALRLGHLPDNAERDAALLRFELAAELMPKVLRRILSERGADVPLPKDAVRSARSADLVDEDTASALISAIDDRNRMVHDYSERFAQDLHERIATQYQPALRRLSDKAAAL
jgi:nucleotidyltransferase substrate binding protein (TIGR01987 family)